MEPLHRGTITLVFARMTRSKVLYGSPCSLRRRGTHLPHCASLSSFCSVVLDQAALQLRENSKSAILSLIMFWNQMGFNLAPSYTFQRWIFEPISTISKSSFKYEAYSNPRVPMSCSLSESFHRFNVCLSLRN